jgi:SAM-dependent methyltransferase
MRRLEQEGHIFYTRNGIPRIKRYLDEAKGTPMQDLWTDLESLRSWHTERLGYPTQKPVALLERIIAASSNAGDVVLDPFCGCGTAVHAAEKLNRQWIGIDITHLSISLIEKRLKDAFPENNFDVHGTPKDYEGAADLAARDKYQFQWWACSLVNAQPYQGKKKGADSGIDGIIYFYDDDKEAKKVIVSVKGGVNVSVAMVRDLVGVVEREKAAIGLFLTLTPPTNPMTVEAVKSGYYESSLSGTRYQKLQILTIEGLLIGTERPQHPKQGTALNFKKAKVEAKGTQERLF